MTMIAWFDRVAATAVTALLLAGLPLTVFAALTHSF
jgi:hypothetical protein